MTPDVPLTSSPLLTVYTTSTCGPCVRLKRALMETGIDYSEINLETDDSAAAWVMSVNSGSRTVPTVKFADGSSLTNPSLAQVIERLGSAMNAQPPTPQPPAPQPPATAT